MVSWLLTLHDNRDPVITCPADLSVPTRVDIQGAIVNYGSATCTDPDQDAVTVNCSPATGGFFRGLGARPVNCTCQDNRGASDSCLFTVTVTPLVAGNQDPVITCPADISVPTLDVFDGAIVNYVSATCTDPDQDAVTVDCSPSAGLFQGLGARPVTCTCVDNRGASSSCRFTVTINAAVNIRPTIDCPASFAVQAQGATVVPWERPGCTDPDQDDATLLVSCSPMPNSVFPPGTRSVTCTCTDNQQLNDQCTFTVTVQPGVGNQEPVITCPADLSVPTLAVFEGAIVNYDPATCTDQEEGTLAVDCSPAAGLFQGLGARPVTCTCADDTVSVSCQFIVTITPINPGIPPTIVCPASFVVQAQGATVVPWDRPGCTDPDQNDATLSVSCSPMPNSVFPPGTRSVTCTCTDNQQLSDQCTFTVTVQGGGDACLGAPCGADECRLAGTRAGYTCHSIIGIGCN